MTIKKENWYHNIRRQWYNMVVSKIIEYMKIILQVLKFLRQDKNTSTVLWPTDNLYIYKVFSLLTL